MSLQQFKQALCDLIASPDCARQARFNPDVILDSYELSDRERRRLVDLVRQKGMSVNCSLYRMNRITPLYTLMPLTCSLLGPRLIGEAEEFWRAYDKSDLQFK